MTASAVPPEWLVPVLVAAAYAWGGISPGWWLVRRKAGIDLRTQGSGATGASNVSRVLGTRGYASVMILDTVKGMAAVYGARWLAPHSPWAALAAPAVVAGHIWPVWLGFRGGRGAATFMGCCIALDWMMLPIGWAPGVAVWLLFRKAFLARAVAFAAGLPAGLWLLPGLANHVSVFLAWIVVLLAHRSHFAKQLSG